MKKLLIPILLISVSMAFGQKRAMTTYEDLGKAPVRYIQFPREPHGFREPRHQRVRDLEEINWVQKYTTGLEWEPWERKKEKKDESEKPDDTSMNVERKKTIFRIKVTCTYSMNYYKPLSL